MKKANIIEITTKNKRTSRTQIANFISDIAIDSVSGAITGALNTVSDFADGVTKLSKGDLNGALDITINRFENMVKGAVKIVDSSINIAEAATDSITSGKNFITEENKENLTNICTACIYTFVGTSIVQDLSPSGDLCPGSDSCVLPGVENGVFTGDTDDLEKLIQAGEIEDTEHVSNIERSEVAKTEFLNAHGITDTNGLEIHHVVPLSEGGADNPDNMVLIDPECHDEITKEHSEFYDWLKKS